jgi:hypothetical protein
MSASYSFGGCMRVARSHVVILTFQDNVRSSSSETKTVHMRARVEEQPRGYDQRNKIELR